MATKLKTKTIKNMSNENLEIMLDYKLFYLAPGQEWTLQENTAEFIAKKWFRQLEIVDSGRMESVPPSEKPKEWNAGQTEVKPPSKQIWCQECGKEFKSSGQLMMHEKKHEKERKAVQAA